jgi:endoglycosylceramidase
MGYDLMNEPWPGSPWTTCANNVGCPAFDTQTLQPFNELVTNAIREVDTRNVVWYEPNVLYNNGPQTHLGDVAGEAGMSFHVYCLEEGTSPDTDPAQDAAEAESCALREELPFTNAVAHSGQTDNALLLTEFGASDDLGEIERIIRNAERFLVGWQYWHYCNCGDPTTSGSGGRQSVVNEASLAPEGDNLKEDKLQVLARPNPQAVAGTPTHRRFDLETRLFELDYSTERVGGGSFDPLAETEVFLPERQYPRGYDVDVRGADPVSSTGARLLRLRACPGRREVTLRVRPGDGVATSDCAAPAPAVVGPPVRPRLRLVVRPRRVRAGRRVRFRFRAFVRTGDRKVYIRGVRIRFAGRRARTGRAGRAVIRRRLGRAGRHRARASRPGFRPARTAVRARPAR